MFIIAAIAVLVFGADPETAIIVAAGAETGFFLVHLGYRLGK